MFQSLSGFQVRCNKAELAIVEMCLKRFNPYRVFKFVATSPATTASNGWCVGFNPYRVFKFVATLLQKHCCHGKRYRFNPYRVFKFVATVVLRHLAGGSWSSFNPYRVFKFVATKMFAILINLHFFVSIPIGFSSSLQQKISSLLPVKAHRFNPYRVFKFVATAGHCRG